MGQRSKNPTSLSFRAIIASFLLAPFYLAGPVVANESPPQHPVARPKEQNENDDFHVAIIGAGIAGASAAYHMHQLSASGFFQGRSVVITIIESSDEVGGQVKTISPPGYDGDRFRPLEMGAPSFFEDDWCLMDVAQQTRTALSQSRKNRRTNDGRYILKDDHFIQDRFCEKNDLRPYFWTWREVKGAMYRMLDWLDFQWTQRFLPWQIQRKLKTHLDLFRDFGRHGTFDNTIEELKRCGLGHEVATASASVFLENMGMTRDVHRTLLEPCIMESYGLSVDEALGLHAVLSAGVTRPNASVLATDGNQRMISRIIEKSGATLHLNSRAVRLEAGIQRRYLLWRTYESMGEEQSGEDYDAVIATGDALHNLLSLQSRSSKNQTTTYKTYFSTTSGLDPTSIGLKSGSVPRSVLFAAQDESSDPKSAKRPLNVTSITTWPEFYIDSTGCAGDDDCDQFVNAYVAESTSALSKGDLSRLTGTHEPIGWSQSHSWQRHLPIANSSDTHFGDIQVKDFLYDAGTRILDSMEMSCRMGRNIALKVAKQSLDTIINLDNSRIWTEADLLSNIQGLSQGEMP